MSPPFVQFKKKQNMALFSDGSDSESKKYKRGYMIALMVWSGLHLAGVWSLESGGLFIVGTFLQESGFCRHEDDFTFNLLHKDM
jgi:hypothetical protein